MSKDYTKEISMMRDAVKDVQEKTKEIKMQIDKLDKSIVSDELNKKLEKMNNDSKYTFRAPSTKEEAEKLKKRMMDAFYKDMSDFIEGFNGNILPNVNKNDSVNHPSHYQSDNGTECIEAMEKESEYIEKMGLSPVNCFCYLNAFKYIWRKDSKGFLKEDEKKAMWYIDRLGNVFGGKLITYSFIEKRVAKYKK